MNQVLYQFTSDQFRRQQGAFLPINNFETMTSGSRSGGFPSLFQIQINSARISKGN
jgi:hypothetical protein